jgi:hypothetical protein
MTACPKPYLIINLGKQIPGLNGQRAHITMLPSTTMPHSIPAEHLAFKGFSNSVDDAVTPIPAEFQLNLAEAASQYLIVLGKFGLCLKLISEIGGLEWSVCSEILEPPCPITRDGGSKISKQTDHSKPPISLISFRHKPNFPNTKLEMSIRLGESAPETLVHLILGTRMREELCCIAVSLAKAALHPCEQNTILFLMTN